MIHSKAIKLGLALLVGLSFLSASSRAQCLEWSGDFPPSSAGANGDIRDFIVWNDGSGSALYVAGDFTSIGGVGARRVAKWNGSRWSALGAGLNGEGIAFAVFDDGTGPALYVGGYFTVAGGMPAANIARWDGSSWSTVGSGVDSAIIDATTYDDGTGPALYVAGSFTSAGAGPANGIAKWDGSTWSGLGSGLSNGSGGYSRGYALKVFDAGTGPRLYVGGHFGTAGGINAGCIAAWDGSQWSAPGSGVDQTNDSVAGVDALETFNFGAGNELVAAGYFYNISGVGAQSIARWNGSTWTAVGNAAAGSIVCLAAFDDGGGASLYVGGFISIPNVPPNTQNIARWTGSAWTSVGGGFTAPPPGKGYAYPNTLFASYGGVAGEKVLYAGGPFMTAGGNSAPRIAKWKGCQGPGTLVCFGDGTGGTCPCMNSGVSRHGCQNSDSTGGSLLSSSGTTAHDMVQLRAQGELASALTIFLQGDEKISATSFGDGLRCLSGNLKRLYVKTAASGVAVAPEPGDLSIKLRSAALGDPIQFGTDRWYQAYYRDPNISFCPDPPGDNWNVSNGLKISW